MSPRTDSYLSLCLEQASKSPLHYRHGSIIVRGGKVIGQGYNDYRPGFNGGALKTGRLASTTNGPAIAELKQKRQMKKLPTQPDARLKGHEARGTFTPFETSANGGGGGGHLANTPLSMHSEMMAIHSALSLSGTLACPGSRTSRPSAPRPSSSSSGSGKGPGARVAASVRREDRVAYGAFNGSGVKRLRINAVDKNKGKGKEVGDNEKSDEKARRRERGNVQAMPMSERGEKDRIQESGRCHHEGQDCGHHHVHGLNTHAPQHAHESAAVGPSKAPICLGATGTDSSHEGNSMRSSKKSSQVEASKPAASKPTDCLKFAVRLTSPQARPKHKTPTETPKAPQALLIPHGRTGSSSRTVSQRTQSTHLKGADLYVARLGRKNPPTPLQTAPQPQLHNLPTPPAATSIANPSPTNPPSATSTPTPPTSLHDELRTLPHTPSPASNPPRRTHTDRPSPPLASVGASRPCYRCIAYMHAVGIKRVFWTDANGGWEGAKVRDLVDALEMAGSSAGGPGCAIEEGDGRATGKGEGVGVFVTKHEVLMLRRLMGGS